MSLSQATRYLKLAQLEDKEVFLELVKELYDASVYSAVSPFDREKVEKMLLDSFEADQKDICTVLLMEGNKTLGLMTMSHTDLSFMENGKVAIELAFWIKPEARDFNSYRKLMQAYFYWAKKIGCSAAFVGKLRDNKSPEYYTLRRL